MPATRQALFCGIYPTWVAGPLSFPTTRESAMSEGLPTQVGPSLSPKRIPNAEYYYLIPETEL